VPSPPRAPAALAESLIDLGIDLSADHQREPSPAAP